MNKKVLIGGLLCIAGFTSLFGLGTGFAFDLFGTSTINQPLLEVHFSSGGDMQGSTHGMSVKAIGNNSALVKYDDAKWHNEIINVKEYVVPATVLEDIKTIFNDNKLARCEKASKSKFVVLDGATSSYYFTFKEKSIRFSSTQNLSKDNYTALKAIKKCVADACLKGKRLPVLVLEKDKDGYAPIKYVNEKGKLAIKVVGYNSQVLSIAIGNATEEDKKVSLNSKIIALDKDGSIVAEKTTQETIEMSKESNDEYRWKLDKPLEPGKYRVALGEYVAEFEIK